MKKITLVTALVFILSVASLFSAGTLVYADGNGSPVECLGNPNDNPNASNVHSSIGGNQNLLSDDVGAGNIVTGICIKSADHSPVITANGTYNIDGSAGNCYQVTGIGTQIVTVTRLLDTNECQGLSHIDVIFGADEGNNDNGDNGGGNGGTTLGTTTQSQAAAGAVSAGFGGVASSLATSVAAVGSVLGAGLGVRRFGK